MYQTLFMLDMPSIWLSFYNARNDPFGRFKIVDRSTDTTKRLEIQVPHGFTHRKLYVWLRALKPSVVHTQGALRKDFERVTHTLNIPLISGFHFWHGVLLLNKLFGNVRIKENRKYHKLDDDFAHTLRCSDIIYGPSKFFVEAVGQVAGQATADQFDVLLPMPDENSIMTEKMQIKLFEDDDLMSWPLGFVTMINIHESKGGRLFLKMLQELPPNIPLLGVRTDVFRTDLDDKIDSIVKSRSNCFVIGRVENVSRIYNRTALLIQASECDETFCRVLVEAQANGIPTLVSDYGNLPHLLITDDVKNFSLVSRSSQCKDKSAALYQKWIRRIEKAWSVIQTNPTDIRTQMRDNYKKLKNLATTPDTFRSFVDRALVRASERRKNVAIFTPWCDMGLGIQSRNYTHFLKRAGFKVSIFAFRPYSNEDNQANPDEWKINNVDVYYSQNYREKVTRNEVQAFVLYTRASHVLLPETCWFRVFEIIKEVKQLNVRTYAVPNVEIVRKDELEKHHVFDKILINNKLCENVFVTAGFTKSKVHFIGYAIDEERNSKPKPAIFDHQKRKILTILILGGRNAVSRKHVDVFVTAVATYAKRDAPIRIIATSQLNNPEVDYLKEKLQNDKRFEIIVGNLTKKEISNLYQRCDVVAQISKHEGLGIGFFEALDAGKPIITLNVHPHVECAPENVAWHIEPDDKLPNDENDSSPVLSAQVSVFTFQYFLTDLMYHLTNHNKLWWANQYEPRRKAIVALREKRFEEFEKSFIEAFGS